MIINTNQPRQARIGMTRQEREERAAAAARHRQLDELRARVRASMAGGDETPADPDTYRKAGLQAAKTWEAIERRAPTGKRQKIKGRIESGCGGNKRAGRDVTPLRGLPTIRSRSAFAAARRWRMFLRRAAVVPVLICLTPPARVVPLQRRECRKGAARNQARI